MSVLYLEHFNLSTDPFRITPDTEFFFSGGQRGDILEGLIVASMHDEGILSVVGEIGMGKTMLSRMLLDRLRPLQADTVYLANPVFDRDEILSAITRDLMTEPPRVNRTQSLAVLETALIERYAKGRRVVVVIDEAHSMPGPTLEEIRLLSNLETSHHKLLKIVLFGQPELDELLNSPRLRQVKDRVSHRFELPPLTAEEASAYLTFRLQKAGWQGGELFDAPALKLLVQVSEGRTRKLNMLADKSMLAAYAEGVARVGIAQVRRACGDNQPTAKQAITFIAPAAAPQTTQGRMRSLALPALGLLATLGLGYAIGYGSGNARPQEQQAIKSVPVVVAAVAPTPTATAATIVSNTIATSAISSPAAIPANNADTVTAPAQTTTTQPTAAVAVTTAPATAAPIEKPAEATPPPKSATVLSTPDLASMLRNRAFEIRKSATDQYFANPNIQGFTVQVLAQRAPKSAEMMAVALEIQAALDASPENAAALTNTLPVLIHDRIYQQQLFHAIYVGQFETRLAALQFIESAPPPIKRYKPIIRSMEAIRKEPTP
jgi:MSHA biogenesis protein MshM